MPPRRAAALLLGLTALCACARGTRPLRVLAAASAADALAEAVRDFSPPVELSAGASSTLARQLIAGAPADVFVSADPQWVDELERRGLLLPGTRRALFANRLVLVVPAGAAGPRAPGELAADSVRRVSTGDPALVPLGAYAKAALSAAGAWEAVAGKLLPAVDARAALGYVERGEADCGIVYKSDARASARVRVVYEFPPESHAPIRYWVAATRGAGEDAVRLLDSLASESARAIWLRRGFETI